MNASDILTSRARLSPAAVALTDYGTGLSYTYLELQDRAVRAAECLSQHYGVRAGDRVALLAPNGIVYVDLFFGLARIGAILVPLNWRLTTAEIRPILKDCAPKLIIFGEEFRSIAELSMEGMPAKASPIAEWYQQLDQTEYWHCEPLRVPEEFSLAILYTSGTTGTPKGAMISHRQVVWNCINTVISWELVATDVAPILTPMFHAGGLFVFLTPLLYVGGRIVLTAGLDPVQALALIEKEHCTVILGVPTLFQVWLHVPEKSKDRFNSVRWFISGGAPCPATLIRQWRESTGTVLRQGYGLTEVGVNCFSMNDEESLSHAGSVGKPIFHSAMKIVNAEGIEVAVGEIGELWIAGPHVFSGYWNNHEGTAAVLRDGWFHTGDMARRDGFGYFTIAGRYKDMIISGGENIYAAEVEAVFKEHPAVADAALIGESDPKWGEVGVMVVVRKPQAVSSSLDLLRFCENKLARYKIPKRVVFVSSLPTSPYGKVMKKELKEIVSHTESGL